MIRTTTIRVAWRMLRKNPVTSALAVVALALGIGLTASMFSMVYGVLLSQVPFAAPERLVTVMTHAANEAPENLQAPSVPIHDYLEWRHDLSSFAALAAYSMDEVNLNDEAGYPERYHAGLMTANLLDTLGVEPALGRDFSSQDDVPGAASVVLLGHDLWRNRFAADPAVLGRTIHVGGEPATVIGVMPRGFAFPIFQDLWLPLQLDVSDLQRGEGQPLWVTGRLQDGVGRAAAQVELTTHAARLAERFPDTHAGRTVQVQDYRSSLNSATDNEIIWVMFGAVSLVLLIACANVATLLLARATHRAKELAVRTALGARRWRVVGLLLTESLILSLLGAALGLVLAHANTQWLTDAFSWRTLPFWITFELQPPAVAFVAVAGIVAGLLSGLLPALRATGAASYEELKDAARGSSGLRMGRISRGLVVAELALASALLVASGLMVRTVINYTQLDPGFRTASILTASLTLPEGSYPEAADIVAFYERLAEDLRALPEVENAALMSRPPGTFMGLSSYGLEDASYTNRSEYPTAPRGVVSPEFFATYGIRLLEGRYFTTTDTAENPPVLIVNESFAARTWPGESALGKRLHLGQGEADEPWRTVVGVVPDAGISLLNPAFVGTTQAGFYLPLAQQSRRTMSIAVKTRGAPTDFAATLRQQVQELDPSLPVDAALTMERVFWEQTFPTKIISVAFSTFGAAALLLAAVGIFGVMMFSVQQRRQEIGLRMALGAQPADVLRLVLRQGMGRLALGLGIGLALGWGLSFAIRLLLYGVEPGDPLSFLGTAVVLAAVALIACYIPARRAAGVDPLTALRHS